MGGTFEALHDVESPIGEKSPNTLDLHDRGFERYRCLRQLTLRSVYWEPAAAVHE